MKHLIEVLFFRLHFVSPSEDVLLASVFCFLFFFVFCFFCFLFFCFFVFLFFVFCFFVFCFLFLFLFCFVLFWDKRIKKVFLRGSFQKELEREEKGKRGKGEKEPVF